MMAFSVDDILWFLIRFRDDYAMNSDEFWRWYCKFHILKIESLPLDIRQQLQKLQDDRLRRKLEAIGYTVENTQKMNRKELLDAYAPTFLKEHQPPPTAPNPVAATNPSISEAFETEDLTREKLELEKFKL